MIERLVVAPGAGTVIRHGHVTAWVGELASPNLLTFLACQATSVSDLSLRATESEPRGQIWR